MMNQAIGDKEHDQHGLDIRLRVWCHLQSLLLEGWLLYFGDISVHSGFIISDYLGCELWMVSGLLVKGQCKLTCDCPYAQLAGNGAQASQIHLQIYS